MTRLDPNEGVKSFPKLSQTDLEDNDVMVFTIKGYEQRTMPDGGMVKELAFEEVDPPLRLNKTQAVYLIEGLGTDDTNRWAGKKVPVEKVSKQGPDGTMHDVVWVSAPESWAGIFAESGVKLPAGQVVPTRKVKAATPEPKRGKPGRKPKAVGIKRRGR